MSRFSIEQTDDMHLFLSDIFHRRRAIVDELEMKKSEDHFLFCMGAGATAGLLAPPASFTIIWFDLCNLTVIVLKR